MSCDSQKNTKRLDVDIENWMDYNSIVFREFTPESLKQIERYRQEDAQRIASEDESAVDSKRSPNKELAVGQKLPRILQHKFPRELIGKPIEDIDPYYRTENVC